MSFMIKLKDRTGEARLVVIMALIALVLAIIVIVPMIRSAGEGRLEKLDDEYASTAERIAREKYIEDGKPFSAVFDSENKRFSELKDAGSITEYANASIHKGEYIVVTVESDKDISTEWMSIEEIRELSEGE